MTAPPAWHLFMAVTLGALGFFIPFSSAGVSIATAALIVLAALQPRLVWQTRPWREPTMAWGLALLAYIALHTVYMTGLNVATAGTLSHYKELLFAPLLLALLADERHRRIFLRSLTAGMVLLAAAHWLALVLPELSATLATRRISAGFALAVCAFVLLMLARRSPRPWPARALAAFLGATVLFTVQGRTGHVVLLILAVWAAWLHSPVRWRWLGALAAVALAVVLAMSSGVVGTRLQETLAGSQPEEPAGTLSSTGIRIELLRLASDLARRYGAAGAGLANYAVVHEQAALERYASDPAMAGRLQESWVRSSNPHNEYLMQLIGGGIASLALFLAWLAAPLRQAVRMEPVLGSILAGLALAFAVGSLFNSLLTDFVEAHLYAALLAWVLAENRYGRKAHDPPEPQRILVVATRQIGDVLLTTPLIRAARRRWPGARIEVLGFRGTLGMLRGNPDVDELIETPPRLGWDGARALVRRLWRRYGIALVTDPGDRAHLIGWLAAPRRAGIVPARSASNWWKRLLLDHAVVAAGDLGSVHASAEKQSLLAPWLRAGAEPAFGDVVAPQGAPLPPDMRSQLATGFVVVHAPSMWPYKQWPLPHFQALVRALLAHGRQVVLTGSGAARDQECVAALRGLGAPPQLLDLSSRLDFNQLVTLLRGAALYIGPDTSVSHLAAATGLPVIAILGPTNPIRWAPRPAAPGTQAPFARSALVQQSGNVTVLQSALPCVPCGKAGCDDHRQSRSDCLVDIGPERVIEQALRILG